MLFQSHYRKRHWVAEIWPARSNSVRQTFVQWDGVSSYQQIQREGVSRFKAASFLDHYVIASITSNNRELNCICSPFAIKERRKI